MIRGGGIIFLPGQTTSLQKNEYIMYMAPFICIVCKGEFFKESDLGWCNPDDDKECICEEWFREVAYIVENDAQIGAVRDYLRQSKLERDN